MKRHLISAALAVAFCAGLVWWADSTGYNRAQGEFSAAQLEIERAVRAKERNMQDAADQKAREYEAQDAIRNAALAVASGQLDRLLADLAAIGGKNTATPSSPAAERIAGILGQCAERLVYYAGEADRLKSTVNGWQEWFGVVAPRE